MSDDEEELFERDTGKSPDIGAPDEDDNSDDEGLMGRSAADEGFEEEKELFERQLHEARDGDEEDLIGALRESRDQLDELITAMHRMQRVDHDTDDIETRIQGLIDREFRDMDAAIDEVEAALD